MIFKLPLDDSFWHISGHNFDNSEFLRHAALVVVKHSLNLNYWMVQICGYRQHIKKQNFHVKMRTLNLSVTLQFV